MYEQKFFQALVITILIETFALFLLIEKFEKEKPEKKLILFTGFISSFATLPYVWYLFPRFINDYSTFIFISETSVVFTEAIIYYFILKFNFTKCLTFSFLCNALSTIIGLIINNW